MPPYKDLPADQLATVQGTIQLEKTTATAWFAFKAAAKQEANITITIAAPLGGYRSHAQDVDFHAHPEKYNKNPNIGLLPIDYSVHRTGRCVDVVPWPAWVKNNAHRFGFTFPITADVNHMQHDGTTTSDNGSTPLDEDEMSAAAEEAIMAIKAALLDGRPEYGMAKGALDVIYDGTRDIQGRMMAATGGQWDAFDEIVKNTRATLALEGKPGQAPFDAAAVAAAIRQGLGDEIANELAKRLAS